MVHHWTAGVYHRHDKVKHCPFAVPYAQNWLPLLRLHPTVSDHMFFLGVDAEEVDRRISQARNTAGDFLKLGIPETNQEKALSLISTGKWGKQTETN